MRLQNLASRYSDHSDGPSGEAFYRAFRKYLKANRESLLDVAIAAASVSALLDDQGASQDPLLLKAIGDTNPSLADVRLFGLDGEQLEGAINTAKGKYFEYLVADRLNRGMQVGPLILADGQFAELASSPTQPGWDLRIVDAHGNAIEYLQLKATDSVGYVRSALERYPDIQILATEEVAQGAKVLDSGLSDDTIHRQVIGGIETADQSLSEQFLDHFSLLLPLAAMSLYEGYRLYIGQQSLDSFKDSLARRGKRMATTHIIGTAVYFMGGGVLSVPSAFAGGLLFDRFANQSVIASSYEAHRKRLLAQRLLQQERELSRGQVWVS
jgi:hypothetical protein